MKYLEHIKSNRISVIGLRIFELRFVLIAVCGISMFSCESFVDVELPNSQINGKTVFENTGTATAALIDIYARLRDSGLTTGSSAGGITTSMGHYADELTLFSPIPSSEIFFDNTILPSDRVVNDLWGSSYNLIFAANALIEGLNNSTAIPQEVKDQLIGEAQFIRGFVHFYLVNLFGDAPFITTTNFEDNTKASKITVATVYERIIRDLLEAKGLLMDTYVSGERTRPNKGTVSAFLSRVYLYSEDWERAEMESTSIINNTALYVWENDLDKVFLKESTSAIWQFKPSSTGTAATNNTLEGFTFIFVNGPPPFAALSSYIVAAFEPGDNRFDNWVGSATDEGMTDTWYYAFKYKENSSTPTSMEYSILFRLAEQYLIRAEARAQLGDIAGAQADLNQVRSRAGLPDTPANTQVTLLEAILQERQVELFTELGHRFFDLKRTGMADAVLGSIKPGWDATDVLLPIPESELLVNPNLEPQNPGY